jgi:hypothetical protein
MTRTLGIVGDFRLLFKIYEIQSLESVGDVYVFEVFVFTDKIDF